ncbi:MAG: ATP-binding cassette domain-containing protein [Flavobacteriales bacterium]|nr:ATP-binding cassette domain-containing protein [Flavobacteriales bacterium]
MQPILAVDNVSKLYRLGQIGTGTLSHDLNRWWANLRGKEDPYAKVGDMNDRSTRGDSKYVWALNDISFELNRGEVLGVIGRNGAGKSTLLKLLSKVTQPTGGNIYLNGNIASLLEVGTGFHPELTGRENIFLNGAILGMTKKDVRNRIDAIVDFAGIEKYLDTPVKRYSSGMYMRLAFAVAAHLEPDILIVDEVLAVGDAEFQKKCLGKMHDVAEGGRTVLFVSHNMQAINTLCTKGVLLDRGQLVYAGSAHEAIRIYQNEIHELTSSWKGESGDENAVMTETWVRTIGDDLFTDVPVEIGMKYTVKQPISNLVVGFHLKSQFDDMLAYILFDDYDEHPSDVTQPGMYEKRFVIPPDTLSKGNYYVQFDLGIHDVKRISFGHTDVSFYLINRSGKGCRFPVQDVKGYTSLFRPRWYQCGDHNE